MSSRGDSPFGSPLRLLSRAWQRLSPPAYFVLSFAALIAVGTAGLLLLPGLYTGARLGAVDALFTAASAVCVTGLVVVDTATYFTRWGQLWLLLLIQLGGLGVITLTSAIIGAIGRQLSLRSEMTSVALPRRRSGVRIWQIAKQMARFTVLVESVGAVLLFSLWLPHFPAADAAWHALFHAISAFCNAGFSTFSDSLVGFSGRPSTLLVISALVIVGGLGFLVVDELRVWWRPPAGGRRRLSAQTYAVLTITGFLLLFGTGAYALFEWRGVLAGMDTVDRIANAWFMSVTARTAGFNSVSYGELANAAGFLTMMLMFVGGSPGSTAGGVKTTTLALLVALARSRMSGRAQVELHDRGIPAATVERTVSLVLLAFFVLTGAFFTLSVLYDAGTTLQEHRSQFLPVAFESVSAFATVGLSMGITAALDTGGKIAVIVLMFVGRVGLLSFFSALVMRERRHGPQYRLAHEDVVVG